MKHFCISLIQLVIVLLFTPTHAQEWNPVPLVDQGILDAGARIGGEGGQVIDVIKLSPDNTYMLMGTNTGGIYRRDKIGGNWGNWHPCNSGFDSRGAMYFEIDPRNTNRALGIGCSAAQLSDHGMYLSTDKGKSWKPVKTMKSQGDEKGKLTIAYDPTSYDAGLGYCKVAYWVFWGTSDGGDDGDAIYKTTDGGENWNKISDLGYKGFIQVHQTSGEVFYAGNEGLYKSPKGGGNFSKVHSGNFTGLDIAETNTQHIYACTPTKIYYSSNGGSSWSTKTHSSWDLANIRVSPVNPQKLMMSDHFKSDWWAWNAVYSHDGGNTLNTIQNQSPSFYETARSFFPLAPREGTYEWSNTNENVVWAVGGDAVYRSDNGGKFFNWDNDGFTGVMLGKTFNFNPHRPASFFLGFQDKNCAWTNDHGATWNYIDWTGKGHGHLYGGMLTDKVMVTTAATGWSDPRVLQIKPTGGSIVSKGITISVLQVAYVDPTDESVLFMGNYRSTNDGQSWSSMSNCTGVFIHDWNPNGNKALLGYNGSKIVKSTNKGSSWSVVKDLSSGTIKDLAYDYKNEIYYAVTNDGYQLTTYNVKTNNVQGIKSRIPADQFGNHEFISVAVDPQDPEIVYVAQNKRTYNADNAIMRSTDAGQTWEPLTVDPRWNNLGNGIDGGRMPNWIRVNPETRYLWVGGGCYGIWKIAPPGSDLAPNVNAGNDQTINLPTNSTTITGSATDDGNITNLLWTQESGPSNATMQGENTATLTISNLVEGTYVFKLEATDDTNQKGSDQVAVNVLPEQTADMDVYKTANSMTIDGQLNESDWLISEPISILLNGSTDNNATFGLLWDDNNLYVGVNVEDANLYSDSDQDWNDDAVEVYIDGNYDRSTSYDANDNQIIQQYNKNTLWSKFSTTAQGDYFQTANGYSVEIAIPWSSLGTTAMVGKIVGLDVGFDDDDDGSNRDAQLVWKGSSTNWQDPSQFGSIKLIEGNPVQTTYDLAISASGQGTTTPAAGTHTYDEGSVVDITATPDTGHVFTGWSGDASGTNNPLSITMDADKNITANFNAIPTYTLTVTSGHGMVTKSPEKTEYLQGESVTLSVVPDDCYSFTGWSGDASGTATSVSITMDGDKTVTANYAVDTYTLTYTAGANGNLDGVLSQTVDCGTNGTTVTVVPNPGYEFASWSDGSNDIIRTDMNVRENISVTATFTEIIQTKYTLSVTNGDGDGSYLEGETVNIAANSAPAGKEFDQWTGDTQYLDGAATSANNSVTMPASNVSLTATYQDLPTYTLSVTNGDGDGSYLEGETVNIAADAAPAGEKFGAWTGDTEHVTDASSASTTVVMPASNVQLTATYMPVACDQPDQPSICIVTVDNQGLNNVVTWDNQAFANVQNIKIYKESNISNTYTSVATVEYSQGYYQDIDSDPEVQSSSYKITGANNCGDESILSGNHRTLHLTINQGVGNNWNLIWNPYEGLNISTYNIYRGTSASDLKMIGSVNSNTTSYTDKDAPAGIVYYQVEALNPASCGAKKAFSTLSSKSNIINVSSTTGTGGQEELVSVFPNPARGYINVAANGQITRVSIVNMLNQVMMVEEKAGESQVRMDISSLPDGIYILRSETENGHFQKATIIKE